MVVHTQASAKHRTEYKNIASELKNLSESLAQHMSQSRSFRMSNCIANIAMYVDCVYSSWRLRVPHYSSIEQQVSSIKEKQEHKLGMRLVEAAMDEDAILEHYRYIESLFRQLQVSL